MKEKSTHDYVYTYFWILITAIVLVTGLIALGIIKF